MTGNGNGEVALLLWANTIGLSIISETLRSAAMFILNTNAYIYKVREYRESYAFVQGTGLDMVMQQYGLNYDPDELRNGFNSYLRKISH